MFDENAAHPTLYGKAGEHGGLELHFLECAHCQALTFPSSSYGCRQCGAAAETGRVISRPGRAALRSAITVHAKLHPALTPPYVVGELELAPGVVVEGVLTVSDDQDLLPGTVVQAVAVDDPAQPGKYLCRFQPLPSEEKIRP